jgi:hypothetical protein
MLQIKKSHLHYLNLISSKKSLNFRQSKQSFGGELRNGTWNGMLSLLANQVQFEKTKISSEIFQTFFIN